MVWSLMRLGFVGIGKHATRLRSAFLECGATVVAYDRKGTGDGLVDPSGWGERMPWSEMVTARGVDGIVCCAPPAVTQQVALQCARLGRRIVATKPLMWTKYPADCNAVFHANGVSLCSPTMGFYVDLWRLYSPAWQAMKADLEGKVIRSIRIEFGGDGPVRGTHSGLLDYGPHALAFLNDLGFGVPLQWHELTRGVWFGKATGGDKIEVCTGNGFRDRPMFVDVTDKAGNRYFWQENEAWQDYATHQKLVGNHRDLALRNFCRAFLAGEPSDTLRISCEAMRMLKSAEEPNAIT